MTLKAQDVTGHEHDSQHSGAYLTEGVRKIVEDVIEPASHDCDLHGSFPEKSLAALRSEGLLNAAIPKCYGGLGLALADLSEITRQLARGCGSTSMIWAMHQIQIGCLALHAEDVPEQARILSRIANSQALVASVTSEVGVGGDLRTSIAAINDDGNDVCSLTKGASTISYADWADAFLVTARRTPASESNEQVAVIAWRNQVELESTGGWDAMGMRGTMSPGFRITASFDRGQILPTPFGSMASLIMLPWSHILWSSCWYGMALEAFARARRLDGQRRRNNSAYVDHRLAEAGCGLSLLRASITDAISNLVPTSYSTSLPETIRLNDLKVSASRIAFDVASTCLEICGMPGYQERGQLSIARILRDLLSARLMVSNERLLAINARSSPARFH